MILWTVQEVARQLQVSARTVFRLIERGQLPGLKLGRLVRVPADAVLEYVAHLVAQAQNAPRVVPVAWKEVIPCHTEEKTRLSGGSVSTTQAAIELDALLARKTARKPKRSKPSGSWRPTK